MNQEKMKAMITIVNRGDGISLAKLYARYGVQLHLQIAASGTASSEIMNMLGLTIKERDLMLGFGPESSVNSLLNILDDDYRGILSVRGIAFSLPLTGITNLVAAALSKPGTESTTEGGHVMPNEKEYNLIFVTVNQGYTDDVMHTACAAGATGGSVIRGRWVGAEPLEKFNSITLQDEKEIIVIACSRERRNAIMDAINTKHGLHSREQAVVCSMPVDRFVRLS